LIQLSFAPYFVENWRMKNLFTLFLIFFSISGLAQNSNRDLDEMHQQMEKNKISLDSTMNNLDSSLQRANKFNDSMETARQIESNNRNLTGLVNMMQDREKKERQTMWLRIGLGIGILIIGIIGIARKKKVNSTS
jgi:hypothetical protein